MTDVIKTLEELAAECNEPSIEDQIKDIVQTDPPRRGIVKKLLGKDTAPHQIGQPQPVSVLPAAVTSFAESFKRVQEQAAKEALELAEWMEDQARQLRDRAAILNHQAEQIPDDLRNAVEYERATTERMQFLSALRK